MKTLQNIAASLSFCYLGTLLVNLRFQPKRKKTGMRKPQGRDKTYHCSAAPHVTIAPRDLGRPSESASKTFGFEHKSAAYTHTHTRSGTHYKSFNSPSLLKTCTSNVCYSRCGNLLQEVKVKNRSVWGASTGTKVRECPRKCKTCAPEQRLSVWIYLQPNRTGTGYAPSKNNQTSLNQYRVTVVRQSPTDLFLVHCRSQNTQKALPSHLWTISVID